MKSQQHVKAPLVLYLYIWSTNNNIHPFYNWNNLQHTSMCLTPHHCTKKQKHHFNSLFSTCI